MRFTRLLASQNGLQKVQELIGLVVVLARRFKRVLMLTGGSAQVI